MNTQPKHAELQNLVSRFPDAHVGVVGDVMLDIFTRGTVHRISPEAPVPVVLMDSELQMPGGAGNVAMGIAKYGAQVDLFGAIGEDISGEMVRRLFHEGTVSEHLVQLSNHRTTVKHRIIAEERHMLRVDWEKVRPISEDEAHEQIKRISECIPTWDAVVIADYAKGFMTESFIHELLKLTQEYSLPVIVDTKPSQFGFYQQVSLLTPNLHEACSVSGSDNVRTAGALLQEMCGSPVLITQSEHGMTLFVEGDEPYHVPATATTVVDVSGAGDTVAVTTLLALASGATLQQAVILANTAAGIVVAKPGTSYVTTDELRENI